MSDTTSFNRSKFSTFKLKSLLEITNAINENLSIDKLLKRYEKILEDDLNIGQILIFNYNEKWNCILKSKVSDKIYNSIEVERDLLEFKEISFITSSLNPLLKSFDIIIPIIKNDVQIAYVLIGDIDEEAKGVSPVIKHLHFIKTLSNILLSAIENIRLHQESLRQEALKRELELASKMQSMLIPDETSLPKNDKIFISSFYHPHFEVGGDYYDFIELSKKEVGFCIADVSGKGISAAILMSNFQANLRALFTSSRSLSNLVIKLNERVMSNAHGEKFITLFVAKYNTETRELKYINAGHNPPILYKIEDKEILYLTDGCVGVGMLDEIPKINIGNLIIDQKAKLLCYTDGLVEIVQEDSDNIELETKFIEKGLSNTNSIDKNIDEMIDQQNILQGNDSIFDDISIIGIEFY